MLNWQSRNSATLNLFLTLLQEQLVNLVVRFSFSCIGNVFAFFSKKTYLAFGRKKEPTLFCIAHADTVQFNSLNLSADTTGRLKRKGQELNQ
jgi:hypothetical protein